MVSKKIILCSLCFLALNCLETRPVRAGQDSPYTIQVETLSFEPAARAVVNRLKARGYKAYFESQAAADEKMIYKVRFGRFATREQADVAAQDYRRNEQRECFVVQAMLHPVPASPAMEAVPEEASPSVEEASPLVEEVSSAVSVSTPALKRPEAAAGKARGDADGREFYTVQIAAKADKFVAQEFVDRLHRKGYPAFVLGPDAGDVKPFYRIRIGRYETRAQAEQAGRDYAEREQGDYLVVLSPVELPDEGKAAGPEVSAAAALEPGSGSSYFFTVQVCVRETLNAAESYAGRVRSKGFEPYIATYETSEGKKLYRVRMGKFQERAQADELARTYAEKGGSDFLVVRTEEPAAQPEGLETAAEPPLPEHREQLRSPRLLNLRLQLTDPLSRGCFQMSLQPNLLQALYRTLMQRSRHWTALQTGVQRLRRYLLIQVPAMSLT
jgi:cell division septation protein DedD